MLNKNLYGAGLILLVALLATISHSLTHALPCVYSPFQILFIKSSFGAFLCWVFYCRQGVRLFKTCNLRWQLIKGGAGFFGNIFLIAALQHVPLAQISALTLSSAVFTTLGASLFFNEPISRPIVISLLLCCMGVGLILNPFNQTFTWYVFFPLVSAIWFSLSSLLVKRLALKDASATTLFYLLSSMALLSALPAFYTWHKCTFIEASFLVIIGGVYTLSQLALIEAYTIARAGFLAPFKFARFPFAIFSGLLFFDEPLVLSTLMGGGLIVMSYFFVIKTKHEKAYGQRSV